MILSDKLNQPALRRIANVLEESLLAATRLVTEEADELSLSLGTTKIGGKPDLPVRTTWPLWQDVPLAFIAQINLAELPNPFQNLLPATGLLSFFYEPEQRTWGFDPNDLGSWRVIYFADLSSLKRTESPPLLPSDAHYLPCKVDYVKRKILPQWDSLFIKSLNLSEEERDAYGNLLDEIREELGGPLHQIGGYPDAIQGEMQLECQLAAHGIYCGNPEGYAHPRRANLESGAKDWQLLLQVDSDDKAGMMWGDVGMIYFWIQRQALERKKFDKTWMILQCC